MSERSILNQLKKLFIGLNNLPDWKEPVILDCGPELARYHEMGLSRKKRQLKNTKQLAADNHGIPFFHVPLKYCISANLFSYDPQGWHPHSRALMLYLGGKNSEARDLFFDFYERFCPATLEDFFFGMPGYPYRYLKLDKKESDVGSLIREQSSQGNISQGNISQGSISDCNSADRIRNEEWTKSIPLNIHNDTFEDAAFPWSWYCFPDFEEINEPRKQDRLYFGPEEPDALEREWRRFTKVLANIEKRKYRPDFATPVDGYLVTRSNEYRFVIRRGKHRLAALSALGYKEVLCTFTPGRPRAIDQALLHHWPKVQAGLWSTGKAGEVLNGLFSGRVPAGF